MSLPLIHFPLVVFGAVSVLLYILVLVAIFKNRGRTAALRGSFFQLVIAQAFTDLLMFFEFNIFMRARKYGYLNFLFVHGGNYDVLARIITGLHYQIKLACYSGHVALAANRLSAVMAPLRYELIWTRNRLRLFWVLQWLLPLGLTLPIVCDDKRIIRMVFKGNLLRIAFGKSTFEMVSTVDASCCLLATIACTVLYIAIFLKTARRRRLSDAQHAGLGEMRLIMATFTVYAFLFLDMIAQILIIVFSSNNCLETALTINALTYPLVDAICTLQPWALMVASHTLRKSVFGLFKCGRASKIQPTHITAS